MRLLLVSVLLLIASFAWAQEPLVLYGKLSGSSIDIASYTSFYEDTSGDTLPISVIQTKAFRPLGEKRNERATFSERSVMVTWLRFTLRNSHPTDTLQVLHQTIVHGLISLFENTKLIGQTGISLPPQRRVNRFALPLSVPPHGQRTFYVRVVDYIWSPSAIYSKLLSIRGSYELDYLGQGHMDMQVRILAILSH